MRTKRYVKSLRQTGGWEREGGFLGWAQVTNLCLVLKTSREDDDSRLHRESAGSFPYRASTEKVIVAGTRDWGFAGSSSIETKAWSKPTIYRCWEMYKSASKLSTPTNLATILQSCLCYLFLQQFRAGKLTLGPFFSMRELKQGKMKRQNQTHFFHVAT